MKKTGLFKILVFIILGIALITWFVPASDYQAEFVLYEKMRMGFFDFFQFLLSAAQFKYFIQIVIFLIAVGGFYGVISKTDKYNSWLETVASKFKGKEKFFLVIVAFVLAALNSVFGYDLLLFIFIPAIISIIRLLGYEKITAYLATFGAMLVGVIGSTLSVPVVGMIHNVVLEKVADSPLTMSTNIYAKIALLVLSLSVLIFFLLKAKISDKSKKAEIDDPFIGEKKASKKKSWPIWGLFIFLFVLLVLSCTPWVEMFEIEAFSDLHTTITEFTFGSSELTIFGYLIGTVNAFGSWAYAEMAVVLFVVSVIIGKVYGNKLGDTIENFADGAKKLIRPALLVLLAYTIVYIAGNTLFFNTLVSYIIGKSFNVFLTFIIMIFGSVLHVDIAYVSTYVLPYLIGEFGTSITLISFMMQAIYGVVMFVAPTSVLLILGLSYMGVPYKEYIKKAWKLIVSLLAVVLIVIIAIALL